MCIRVVPCCKNTRLSHFIQFQHYGEKETLAYREMKLLLPGGGGAGGVINWGGRVQKKFFLPGGGGAGGIINWGGRVQKKFFFARGRWCRRHYQLRWQGAKIYFFCQGEVVQEAFSAEVAGCKTIFQIWNFFLIFNLKILPIWFCWVSRCHLKGFYLNFSKPVLLFDICDFSIFKIYSEVVNISMGHPVFD